MLNDRSQGGSSLADGALELMVSSRFRERNRNGESKRERSEGVSFAVGSSSFVP